MNKLVAPIILIILGLILMVMGQRRSNSIAGISATVGAKIANTWDGSARQPDHVWYYIGGGTLIVAGITVALRNKSAS